jgi:sterol 14-demethylase
MRDLDRGFTPLNFLFPSLPLPSYRRRDIAHNKFNRLFRDIMHQRRAHRDANHHDMLETLMKATYKDNTKVKMIPNLFQSGFGLYLVLSCS